MRVRVRARDRVRAESCYLEAEAGGHGGVRVRVRARDRVRAESCYLEAEAGGHGGVVAQEEHERALLEDGRGGAELERRRGLEGLALGLGLGLGLWVRVRVMG